MQIKTKAIVLKHRNIGENDQILTLLSGEYGVIEAAARRSKSLKSRIAAASQVLCYCDVCLFSGKSGYSIEAADIIESFYDLRIDVEKLSLAGYFCELTARLSPAQDTAGEFLRLLLNSLSLLEKGTLSLQQLKAVFEMRAASLGGFMPNLLGCNICGNFSKQNYVFLPQDGFFCCKDCFEKSDYNSEYAIKEYATAGAIAAMRHIVFSDFKKIFFFNLPQKTLNMLSKLTEEYILLQTDSKFKSLEIYRSFIKNQR